MGVSEDQSPPSATVPDHTPGNSRHHNDVESTSLSSTSINKADEALNEKDGKSEVIAKGEVTNGELQSQPDHEDLSKYPHGLKLVTLIIALCLAVFLVALDQTIIATAIPKITDRFHSINDIGWYGSAYFLTSTTLQPSFGRIYKGFNMKWIFLSAVGVFELGSLICGVAPSSTALIVGRAVAGIGVGGIFSGALIIIAHSGKSTQNPALVESLTRFIQFL